MFTGLVETKGTLVRRVAHGPGARLVIEGDLLGASRRDPIALGESIAIDGVCLTVDVILRPGGPGPSAFEVDASSETLARTTLGRLAIGAGVNLERALPIGGRLGGHIVSGHVDGVGTVVSKTPAGGALEVVFEAPPDLGRYIATKGSICVSGVSLTVNHVEGGAGGACRFSVMLIPHTRHKTSLDALGAGDPVNLEVDVLARYVARLLEAGAAASPGDPSGDQALLERLRASGYV